MQWTVLHAKKWIQLGQYVKFSTMQILDEGQEWHMLVLMYKNLKVENFSALGGLRLTDKLR